MKLSKQMVSKLLVTTLLGLSGFAYAQAAKIGLVDVARIEEAPQYKATDEKISKEFGDRIRRLEKSGGDFKMLVEKYQRDAPTLAPAARLARERELAEKENAMKIEQSALQAEYSQRRNEENVKLNEKITKAIRKVAETEQLDLVITNAMGIPYYSPKIDVTAKVLKELAATK